MYALPARRNWARAGLPCHVTYRVDSTHLFCLPAVRLESRDRSAVLKMIARTTHIYVRLCWVKIYSAVHFGEMPSLEIVHCPVTEFWILAVRVGASHRVLRLMKHWSVPLTCSTILSSPPGHCRGLSNERYAGHIRFKYELIRLLKPGSPTVRHPTYDFSCPCRCCRLRRRFHDASAALRLLLAAGYVLWVTFSVFYSATDPFCLFYLLVFLRDTVLSFVYCILPSLYRFKADHCRLHLFYSHYFIVCICY